jgi:cytochrome c-type biogenesis protein CcmH/NrfG
LWPAAPKDARQAVDDFRADLGVIKEAIAADPNNSENFELLGRFYTSLGQTEQAVSAFRQAIALSEKNVWARYSLAKILLANGTEQARNEAERLLVKSAALRPGYWEGSGLLIDLLIREGKLTEAQAVVDWLDEHEVENK